MNTPDNTAKPLAALVFTVGGEYYLADVLALREVIKATDEIVAVAGAAPAILGVMNLRGNVITVFDLRKLLGIEPAQTEDCAIIVAALEDHLVGLMVDDVSTVLQIDAQSIEPPPDLGIQHGPRLIQGLVQREGTLYQLLDLDALPLREETGGS